MFGRPIKACCFPNAIGWLAKRVVKQASYIECFNNILVDSKFRKLSEVIRLFPTVFVITSGAYGVPSVDIIF